MSIIVVDTSGERFFHKCWAIIVKGFKNHKAYTLTKSIIDWQPIYLPLFLSGVSSIISGLDLGNILSRRNESEAELVHCMKASLKEYLKHSVFCKQTLV